MAPFNSRTTEWELFLNAMINTMVLCVLLPFPPLQPLFESAGDDYKIKLFRQPTFRIWNWQSRSSIAILTGHHHYVYSAQFHPNEDQVVSIGLRKINTAPRTVAYDESASQQAHIFGSTDAIVKFVLENSRAWEVHSCRGHTNNVSCTIFHHRQELILSVAEDKTIRVWDMSKRTAVQTFRREHDHFWALTAHPELNCWYDIMPLETLVGMSHDNGLIVFKLERKRPAYSVHQNNLFYIKDKYLRVHDYAYLQDTVVLAVRRTGSQLIQPCALSCNPAECAVFTLTVDAGTFELCNLPKDYVGEACESSIDGKCGSGSSAIFIARGRIAVLEKATQTITIRDM
ncbi:hypothetical protein BGZ96_008957 [Linnemannia gamsii]|uniref:WD40 repeat-like protein n=1 Tax=Linnemannia gamsii TaxID=64522 RepID=A0ABQ7JX98_9FUNG|nr:hypothetical protein BGZ96_008957 [Linnemannia gamsii]